MARKNSPCRGKRFSFVAHPLQGKLIHVFIYFKARNGYYNHMAELLHNRYVINILPFLSLHHSIKSPHFRQTVPVEGGCFQTNPQAPGISSRAPKYHTTTHFEMASGSEGLGNSIRQMPLFNEVEKPVAFLYPLAHGNRLPPLFKSAIRANYEQSENSMAAAFQ